MGILLTTSRGPITIRAVTEADTAAARDLRLESLQLHPTAFGADYATQLNQPMTYWIDWVRARASDRDQTLQVAVDGETLVGMTGLRQGYAPKMAHNGMIWGVYVRPDWRGLHLAEALIETCIAWARTRGVRLVKLAVVTTNTSAIRCYTRCGLRVYGVEPQVIYSDGVYYDELLMAREI
ncbi:MAG TPA: GNAT family N-acetyltransferase [Anaerolineae bacterium]|nr:GNAT family N-acetyltransferase [Anaerolineae bacterium]